MAEEDHMGFIFRDNYKYRSEFIQIIMTEKYSKLVGLQKSGKNFLILWAPAILGLLANVPLQYGAIAGFVAYFIKNYLENK